MPGHRPADSVALASRRSKRAIRADVAWRGAPAAQNARMLSAVVFATIGASSAPVAAASNPPALSVVKSGKRSVAFEKGPFEVLSAHRLEVREPLSGRRMTFEGAPAVPLLDEALGKAWRERDAVIFHCADGYQSLVKVDRILRYQPVLAHRIVDRAGFAVKNTGGTKVPLGPYYLVWDNLKHEELQKTGAKGWPYQVEALEAVDEPVALSPAEPPLGRGAAVKKGYEYFKTHCVACHSVNGVGGRVGPELNYPTSVTEYIDEAWLRRWILDPTSVRHRTAMPGLPRLLPRREKIAGYLIEYLEAMKDKKQPPVGPSGPE